VKEDTETEESESEESEESDIDVPENLEDFKRRLDELRKLVTPGPSDELAEYKKVQEEIDAVQDMIGKEEEARRRILEEMHKLREQLEDKPEPIEEPLIPINDIIVYPESSDQIASVPGAADTLIFIENRRRKSSCLDQANERHCQLFQDSPHEDLQETEVRWRSALVQREDALLLGEHRGEEEREPENLRPSPPQKEAQLKDEEFSLS